MEHWCLRIALVALTAMGVLALSPAGAAPKPAGWALPGYDDSHPADLAALLEPIRAEFKLPALAGAVVTGEELEALGAVGVRKAGSTVVVTPKDEFHLGSCTKAMTGTLIGMLVEEGKLSWGETMARLFPDEIGKADPGWRDVTLDQVLAHRAGFTGSYPPGMNPWALTGTVMEQREVYLKALLSHPPAYPPGTKFEYSNAGYGVLGCLIEKVTGKPWEQVLRERLFEPLGMSTAGFGAAGTPGKIDQPWQHRYRDGEWQPVEPGPRSDNHDLIGPGGKVHASMGDWARFIALHLRGAAGKDGLLKAATLQRLHSTPVGGDYYAGWNGTERPWGGGHVLNHNGSNTMNFCVVWMAPLRNFAVLAATNCSNDDAPKAADKAAWQMIQWYQKR